LIVFVTNFFYRKLVKTTIRTDRIGWIKSVDENLKFLPQKSGNIYHNLGKQMLEINTILTNKLRDILEAFSKYFQSVYSSFCSGIFPFIDQQNGCGQIKSVVFDGTPSFVINGCSEIVVSVLKFIFILTYFRIIGRKHVLSLFSEKRKKLLC
jgi:hypothetical protein